ncbi:hypothetical protein BD769DRAFT_1626247 [Suillus cothurnatus]|nr:hypothetical protein BD769DRAFT_1626247 [Suillus cothurnatus]
MVCPECISGVFSGKHQLFTALNRPISIVNSTQLDVMDEHGLGPNGGMLYCMEYLDANISWDSTHVFDIPGQVELSTNHEALKHIVQRLTKVGFRYLAAVHIYDAYYVTDAAKYLELPHVNVLSKFDLIVRCGDLDFNLDFYMEVQDLSYLGNALNASSPRHTALHMALCSVIGSYNLVGFEMLSVEGHLEFSPVPVSTWPNTFSLVSSAVGPMAGSVEDVQERWIDACEKWDAFDECK